MGRTFASRLLTLPLTLSLAAALLVCLGAEKASAAPPGNDEITQARVITGIPARLAVNTTEATFNPATDTAPYPCMGGNSVWYRFRPSSTVTARVVTLGSEFDTLLGVFRGTSSNLTRVACNDDAVNMLSSAVAVRFRANTTYFIAISTCCSTEDTSGGNAVLRLYTPRAFAFSVVVSGARAGDVSGRAFLSGHFSCANPSELQFSVVISQRVGSGVARGSGFFFSTECSAVRHRWAMTIDTETGYAFRPGRASVSLSRLVSDGFTAKSASNTRTITLRSSPNARSTGIGNRSRGVTPAGLVP